MDDELMMQTRNTNHDVGIKPKKDQGIDTIETQKL